MRGFPWVVSGLGRFGWLGRFVLVSSLFWVPLGVLGEDALVVDEVGYVGMGVLAPDRQLHLRGDNATFRMDRDRNSAAFILTRTAAGDFDTVLKTYVVGVNASGVNNGEFIINDLGSALGGSGSRRMTIANNGNVTFPGAVVTARSFNTTSSLRYKDEVEPLSGVSEALASLRGVRFAWKETGAPDIGLIAEEVAEVFPELVQRDAETGSVESVNYPALVAVLIEGFKTQQGKLVLQEQEMMAYQQQLALQNAEIADHRARVAALERQQSELVAVKAQLKEIERVLAGVVPVVAQR